MFFLLLFANVMPFSLYLVVIDNFLEK